MFPMIYINKIPIEIEPVLMHTLEINSNLELQDLPKTHPSLWQRLLPLLLTKPIRLDKDLKKDKPFKVLLLIYMPEPKILDLMVMDIVLNGQYKPKKEVSMSTKDSLMS
jgi:hypothetical protein